MSEPTSRPQYRNEPIRSIAALSRALGIAESILQETATRASTLYRKAKPITKPDGSIRQPYDALSPLKEIQRRIKDRLLKSVAYPLYLTGSLAGRNYRVNAALHAGAVIVICEDVADFFPSTSREQVYVIWRNLFALSEDVARLLADLCTKDGHLPQGAIPSSYLANLALWTNEPDLFELLRSRGITYSRYVDDITVSSKTRLDTDTQTWLIAQIYGMLARHGYRAKRRKHEVFSSRRRMMTTKLMVNLKPSLPSEERRNIRAAVYALEGRVAAGDRSLEVRKELNRVTSRVGRLGGMHPTVAIPLKKRLSSIRGALNETDNTSTPFPEVATNPSGKSEGETPPWA